MMRFVSSSRGAFAADTCIIFLLFLLAVSTSLADEDTVADGGCTLYVAESTIPNAGFGVYTTKAFKKDDVIIEADNPAIIITDIHTYQPDEEDPDWQHRNYLWQSYGQGSFEARSTTESVVTFGAIPNFHPALKSAGPASEDEKYDDTMFDRFKDPGAGAVSYHMGHAFVARYRDIEANEEIFVDYGELWMDGRDSEGFDKVARAHEFEDAEAVIGMVDQAVRKTTSEMAEPMLDLARGIVELYNNRTLSLIPDSSSELVDFDLNSDHYLARSKLPRRSEEWIKTNGRCIDNIAPKRSTLPQAGMGGFAKRLLEKGSVILPVPVLLIDDSDILNMDYDQPDKNLLRRLARFFRKSKKNDFGKSKKNPRKQLLLNYCLGHGDSKVLLCPQTNAALVNHCSARMPCGSNEGPNAALRWATDWDKATAATLKLSLEELTEQTNRGLTLELYALRDILPGEEIFLDYGEGWEGAWLDHVDNWKPPNERSEFSSYQGVTDILDRKEDFIRTIAEEKTNPLPANIMTGCIYWETDDVDEWVESIGEDDVEDWKLYDHETILEKFGRPGNKFADTEEGKTFAEWWPCAVHMKDEASRTAVVRIYQTPSAEDTDWGIEDIPRFLTDYPMSSISLFQRPWKSDQHLPNAFRHHIGLHDDLFPEQWKTNVNAATPVCNNDDADTCSASS